MMAEKGLNDASRGDGSCITMDREMHHEGKKIFITMEKISIARQIIGTFFITLLPKYEQ